MAPVPEVSNAVLNTILNSTVITPLPASPKPVQFISPWISIIFAFVVVAIILIGTVGNLFVMSVILLCEKMRKSSVNLLLLNLAFADCFNLIVIIPDFSMAILNTGWVIFPVLCPIIRYLEQMFLYASLLLQVLICVERYLAICKPLRQSRLSKAQALAASTFLWLLAIGIASPHAIANRTDFKPFANTHLCHWQLNILDSHFYGAFKVFECLVMYVIPLVLFTTMYTRTATLLWGRNDIVALHGSSQMAEYMLKMRRSVVKMLIICLAIYFFCYSPIQTLFLCEQLLDIKFRLPLWFRYTLNALTLANSAANPAVYILCCRQFREKFIMVLRKVPILARIIPAPGSNLIAKNLKKPTRANRAIRTHLAMTMRMGNPELARQQKIEHEQRSKGSTSNRLLAGGGAVDRRASSIELSSHGTGPRMSVVQRQLNLTPKCTVAQAHVKTSTSSKTSHQMTTLRDFTKIHEERRKQVYEDCMADL